MAEGRSFTTAFLTLYSNKGISELQKQLKELKNEMSGNKRAQKELSKEISDSEKEIKKIELQIKKTGSATEEQQKRLDELNATILADRDALEKLKAEQAQLQSQITETNKRIEDQKTAMQQLTQSMSDAKGHAADFAKTIATVAGAGAAATAGIFAFTKDAAQWADDMNTLSKVTGISTEELQKFAYASNLVDVSMDTLTGSLTKLTRNMAEPSKAAAEAFNTLKIRVSDASGELRDRQTVFYEIIDALGKIGNETKRDALAMDIFGKSAQELNPLIKGGAERLKELGDEAERAGLILSQETLDGLNEFNDKVDLLKSKGEAIKHLAASEMTPALDGLLEVAEELLDEIKEAAKSGELKKTAKEIGSMIKTGATALKNLIGFVWKYKEAVAAAVAGMVMFKIAMSITGLINSVVIGLKSLRAAKLAEKTATDSATASQTAYNIALSSNPIGAVISLVAGLATALTVLAGSYGKVSDNTDEVEEKTRKYTQTMNDLKDSQVERIASVEGEAAKLSILKEEYDELRKKLILTSSEKERLNNLAGRIAEIMGITTQELKDQSGAYKDLTEDIDKYLKMKKQEAEASYWLELIEEASKTRIKAQKELEEQDKKHEALYLRNLSGEISDEEYFDEVRELSTIYESAGKALIEAEKTLEEAEAGYKQFANTLDDSTKSVDDSTDSIESFSEEIAESKTKLAEFAKEEENLKKESSSLRSEMNGLASSVKSLESGEALSLNTLLDLIDKYPEYASELAAAAGNADLQRAALEKLFEAKKNEYILTQQAAIENIQASNDETQKIIANLRRQVEAYSELEKAKQTVFGVYRSASSGVVVVDVLNELADLEKQVADRQNLIDDYKAKIELVRGMKIGDFVSSSGGASGGSSSTGKTADEELLDRQKLALAAFNRLVNNKIDLLNAESEAAKKSADEQIKAIDAVMKKRNEEKDDAKRQKEIDLINTKLAKAHLDEFSRIELERRKQDLLNEQNEANYTRSMEARKTAITDNANRISTANQQAIAGLNASKTQFADRMAYIQGNQSYDQRVQNNSKSVNVTIVQNGMSGDQVLNKLLRELG